MEIQGENVKLFAGQDLICEVTCIGSLAGVIIMVCEDGLQLDLQVSRQDVEVNGAVDVQFVSILLEHGLLSWLGQNGCNLLDILLPLPVLVGILCWLELESGVSDQ